MFLVLFRALSLLYTPSVLLGSCAVFVINACFFIHQKKILHLLRFKVRNEGIFWNGMKKKMRKRKKKR